MMKSFQFYPQKEEEKEYEESEETEVTPFQHKGIKYLKAEDNKLYNPITFEEIGLWDEARRTILEVEDDE